MEILSIILWYGIGIWGFIYWWTTELDFTNDEYGICLLVGMLGPFTWIMGYFVHKKDKVIFKKRD
ncbi:hypothetical protein COB55_05135 [Candidatus Wolfebacteria bacterium]|nr:MAG: hypothetical protein COB55_05135 [Candidatus Wolfebacteria bacterium]